EGPAPRAPPTSHHRRRPEVPRDAWFARAQGGRGKRPRRGTRPPSTAHKPSPKTAGGPPGRMVRTRAGGKGETSSTRDPPPEHRPQAITEDGRRSPGTHGSHARRGEEGNVLDEGPAPRAPPTSHHRRRPEVPRDAWFARAQGGRGKRPRRGTRPPSTA